MLQLNIRIDTVNAAFDITPELECARILRIMADQLESNGFPFAPRDGNGNRCGSAEVVNEVQELGGV